MGIAALRVLLIAGWAITQLVALLIGGWALLGASYGEPGTSAFGVILLLLPGALLIVGLLGAHRNPAQAGLWLGVPLAAMFAGVLILFALIRAARP